ncbi:hypothetical protein BN874_750011 [Candidatus Contendobacter odensis Run_B_J11]|uniref:Uncharacterized protein n=1 Tax=Candidatus Contendobacter odensis Run_B_J11 TaxID=1400861 RepID=A0A7U7J631_9GAMM|nr:hypothetical protein BN874_750011 [Candidatus Contendobacter odensis Run_B_J11]
MRSGMGRISRPAAERDSFSEVTPAGCRREDMLKAERFLRENLPIAGRIQSDVAAASRCGSAPRALCAAAASGAERGSPCLDSFYCPISETQPGVERYRKMVHRSFAH